MFTCYFDDAGSADCGFTAVAGWVSTLERWRAFAEEWAMMLSAYRVPYLNMKELSHFKGPYESWNSQRHIKDSFQGDACKIIARNLLHGFAAIVPHIAYQRVNREYTLREYTGNQYALAGYDCVRTATRWAMERDPKWAIEFIFDDGTPKRGNLVKLMKSEGFNKPIFRSPVPRNGLRAVMQLQAADFLAYEVRKVKIDDPDETRPIEDHRISLRKLIWMDSDWSEYTETDLIATCEQHPKIARRTEGN
jgi:hypothetical protein